MNFIRIPGGKYRIGTTWDGIRSCVEKWKDRLIDQGYTEATFQSWIEKEFPDHWATIADFEMQQTLVCHADIQEFLKETSAEIPESLRSDADERLPVWGVSLAWAQSFANWLSRNSHQFIFRLPTETEWEVAARGKDFREYPYGEEFRSDAANTVESGIGHTTPVEQYASTPGPFGHYDLAGNVEEWVSTPYYIYPGGRLIDDDLFRRFGMQYNVLRGGSFTCGGDLSRGARRHGPFPDPRFRFTGFRLVRSHRT